MRVSPASSVRAMSVSPIWCAAASVVTGKSDTVSAVPTIPPKRASSTVAGDTLECEIEGVGKLTVTIGPPA